MVRLFLFFLLILPFGVSASAERLFSQAQPNFNNIANSQDIPDGIIVTMVQDHYGIIWIGTQYGLVRYDGYEFQVMRKTEQGLCGNYITSIEITNKNKLWLGTLSNGVCSYNPNTQTFSQLSGAPTDLAKISARRINDIVIDKYNNLWIGNPNGLFKVDLHSQEVSTITLEKGLPDSNIHSLLLKENTLWVGSQTGLSSLDIDSPTNISKVTFTTANIKQAAEITNLTQVRDEIWFTVDRQGIFAVQKDDPSVLQQVQFSSDLASNLSVRDMVFNPDANEVILASSGQGLLVVSNDTKSLKNHYQHSPGNRLSLSHNQINSLLIDQSGLIWIGSWGKGLDILNLKNKSFRNLTKFKNQDLDIAQSGVLSIEEARNGDIWLGTFGSGVRIIEKSSSRVHYFRPEDAATHGLNDGAVMAIKQTPNGKIWLGTQKSGLFLYDDEKQIFNQVYLNKNDGGLVYLLLDTPDGNILLAEPSGVKIIDSQSEKSHC